MTQDLIHGGSVDAMRAGFPNAPEPWIDLSTGINPWPYPYTDLSRSSLHRLPTETAYNNFRHSLAAAIGAPEQAVLLAPGSELLIRLLPTVISPRTVAILSPTYGDHTAVWSAAGYRVITTDDPLSFADQVDAIVLCNPNNPDGRVFSLHDLEEARRVLAARDGWLIVDEAYADLTPEISLAGEGGANGLIILRSTGKFFGLAGLRLGALIAPTGLRAKMSDRLGVWPVSGAALEIGHQAYQDLTWQFETRQQLARARQRLDHILSRAEVTVVGGTDLFAYVETGNAHDLWRHLGEAGIYVRRFSYSHRHLRIGLPPDRTAEERLFAALTLSR